MKRTAIHELLTPRQESGRVMRFRAGVYGWWFVEVEGVHVGEYSLIEGFRPKPGYPSVEAKDWPEIKAVLEARRR